MPIHPLHLEHMAGLHLMHPGEGCGAGNHGLHQLVEQTLRGEASLDRRMGEQHLQFGTEHQTLRRHRPVLRFDAEAIPHQVEAVFGPIKQGEGKLTAQEGQGRLQALALIQPQQDLGIALAAEAHPLGGEVSPDPLEVVELTVMSHQHLTVIGEEGLPRP